jgi:hypothetical protein
MLLVLPTLIVGFSSGLQSKEVTGAIKETQAQKMGGTTSLGQYVGLASYYVHTRLVSCFVDFRLVLDYYHNGVIHFGKPLYIDVICTCELKASNV